MLNRFIFKNVFPYTVYYLTPAGPLQIYGQQRQNNYHFWSHPSIRIPSTRQILHTNRTYCWSRCLHFQLQILRRPCRCRENHTLGFLYQQGCCSQMQRNLIISAIPYFEILLGFGQLLNIYFRTSKLIKYKSAISMLRWVFIYI